MNGIFNQDRIKNAHFMVVGCGALGNEVLKNLSLFGAEHIVVVDFDKVELGNLNRSILFSSQDAVLQRRKVDAAAQKLKEINPNLHVTSLNADITNDVGLGWIRRMDVVLGCVDSRWARYCINRWCMRAGVPWVDGGISQLDGTVRVFIPGKNCYACNLDSKELNILRRRIPCSGMIRQQEAEGHAPTTPLIASIIGAVEVQEALKIIHNKEVDEGHFTSLCGSMFHYEGQHLTTRTLKFAAYDDECEVHDPWYPIIPVNLSIHSSVQNVLMELKKNFNTNSVSFTIPDECFVDFIIDKRQELNLKVMKPGRKVSEWIETNKELHGSNYINFYQHEYRIIDDTFPYKELSLKDLGIPSWCVLPVLADEKEYYVEIEK